MLITGKDGFDSERERTLVEGGIAKKRGEKTLRIRERVIVADENHFRGGDLAAECGRGENFLIRTIGIAKIANILAGARGIVSANLALDAGQGVPLSDAAPRS